MPRTALLQAQTAPLLAIIARADGPPSPAQWSYFQDHTPDLSPTDRALAWGLGLRPPADRLASLLERFALFPRDEQVTELCICIGMAAADDHFSATDVWWLGLIADVARIRPGEMRSLCRRVAGVELPDPGDPGSSRWWQLREFRGRPVRAQAAGDQVPCALLDEVAEQRAREEACAILGVRPQDGPDAIRAAYRRQAFRWHPDRHARGEPGTLEQATRMTARLNAAVERLLS
jgi:hypothetical protein